MYGERKTNARCPCTPQSTVETFGEEISAVACSGKEIYSGFTEEDNDDDDDDDEYKWKNHFYEMKGDVGMSLHEKERNKKMPTPRHKVTHNPIPTSLFCFNMLFVCLL